MEKVYKVIFMTYTNGMRDTVTNGKEYLSIGYEPFLVKESDLDKYSKFGDGFRSIDFVGNINE